MKTQQSFSQTDQVVGPKAQFPFISVFDCQLHNQKGYYSDKSSSGKGCVWHQWLCIWQFYLEYWRFGSVNQQSVQNLNLSKSVFFKRRWKKLRQRENWLCSKKSCIYPQSCTFILTWILFPKLDVKESFVRAALSTLTIKKENWEMLWRLVGFHGSMELQHKKSFRCRK